MTHIFYVYAMDSGEEGVTNCIYVYEEMLEEFAQHQFEPDAMNFVGVAIRARDPIEAHKLYECFGLEEDGGEGEVFWVDEPSITVAKRKVSNARQRHASDKEVQDTLADIQEQTVYLIMTSLAQAISRDLLKLNERLSVMAQIVSQTPDGEKKLSDGTAEEIYDRLKAKYIELLNNYGYEDEAAGEHDDEGFSDG